MPPRMIDLMRQSAVPSNIMRAAARGALSLPPPEILEILVYLTTRPVFREQARMTLAGWDEESSRSVASDPATPKAVLDYLIAPENLRPCLLPALLENPSVPERALVEVAGNSKDGVIDTMLASSRVRHSVSMLRALEANRNLSDWQAEQVQEALRSLLNEAGSDGRGREEDILGLEGKSQYEIDHAAEITAEEGKPFRLLGDILDLGFGDAADVAAAHCAGTPGEVDVAQALQSRGPRPNATPEEQERITTLQKIARLTVGERVQLAMKGTRDERFILIRDGARVVSCAVLESPKLTESEIELFASMKNVQEAVLRGISMKRKFMKIYAVVRALASNPRTPIDVGLPLLNHLLITDLKNLSMNKNVADTIRKMAARLLRQKQSPNAGHREV